MAGIGFRQSMAEAQASISTPVTVTAFKTVHCSATELQQLKVASAEALRLLQTSRSQAHFIRWFGDSRSDPLLWAEVHRLHEYGRRYAIEGLVHFSTLARSGSLPNGYVKILPDNITFDCKGQLSGPVAHNSGPNTGTVFLDYTFWSLHETRLNSNRISMASTIIHELTHLAGTVVDVNPSFEFALDLARLFPSAAVWNANNHEWYYYGL